MQQTEMPDYVNERPRHGQKHHTDTNARERRVVQLLVYSFALLCVIQAALNISLRLYLHSSQASDYSDCNQTDSGDGSPVEMQKPCKGLMRRIAALTRDKENLENRNAELISRIRTGDMDRERLQMQLRELIGCESSQQCPAEWRKINSRCYLLSDENKTWEESRQYCQSRGADLVVINSEQEARALYRHNNEEVLLFWIGLRNIGGTFQWVDGSPLTKPFWQPGQPNLNDNEDCVESYHLYPELTTWNDVPCGKIQRWVCEKAPQTSS